MFLGCGWGVVGKEGLGDRDVRNLGKKGGVKKYGNILGRGGFFFFSLFREKGTR